MFQRIKGAIDSRIAEEQARQKATASTPPAVSRSASSAKRSSSRTDSPSARARKPRSKDDGPPPTGRGPDPAEFESAFVIEDESEEPSRVGTPAPVMDNAPVPKGESNNVPKGEVEGGKDEENLETSPPQPPVELPLDVRTKLRKLEKMETRYQELLKSYRIAHKRVGLIEPFEKVLKENTPLATISDPDALVDYLNQLNLKGDMVMEEFKRVSADRDQYKKKLEDAEREAQAAKDDPAKSKESESIPVHDQADDGDISGARSPSAVKSPVISVLGGIFSPKQKAVTVENKDVPEEFFSYDEEVPKLQNEVKEKTATIEKLQARVGDLEKELNTAQEASTGLSENLENATRDLNASKESAANGLANQDKIVALDTEIRTLNEKLEATEGRIATLERDLSEQKEQADTEMESLRTRLNAEKSELEAQVALKSDALVSLKEQHEKKEAVSRSLMKKLQEDLVSQRADLQAQLAAASDASAAEQGKTDKETPDPLPTTDLASSGGAKKKNNKKKKKGGNAVSAPAAIEPSPAPSTPAESIDQNSQLQAELDGLRSQIADKDAQIEKLQTKRKTEADLREEIENMQENLLTIGQEHVEARDQIKHLLEEKKTLEEKITSLEAELKVSHAQTTTSANVESELKTLTTEFEQLKTKSTTLQSDLGAAEKLAADRYKDFRELRAILDKAQPEMTALRSENATLKTAKEELNTRTNELRRLEAREKDLKSDVAAFKKQAVDRDSELQTLKEKVTQETNGRLKSEDQCRVAQRDLRRVEADKIKLSASGEKSAAELTQVQEEATKLRTKVTELESQVNKLTTEAKALRDEVELRGSQYNTAQGLLGSMRDQAGEMAMQLKEAKSASESLEEELTEVQRLLSERTREGETMRRLLADVDDRAEAKVREMRERMEAAVEERDRAEDEASTNARRKAREVDELKNKVRDFERDLKRAIDDRDDLARSEKDWKRRRDELESSSENASKEVDEIRSAMSDLQATLNKSEQSVRDGEKARADLRRVLDEANVKYEKLQKEFKALQTKQSRSLAVHEVPSSRSSIDSRRALPGQPMNGAAQGAPNAYLKTILLQFLAQKDKKVQADLVKTVLGQLLQFDKQDQEKWIAAINAK